MSTAAPPLPPKKRGPLFWILIAVGGLMLVGAIGVGIVAFSAYRMLQNVSTSDNPAFNIAKLAVTMNPELEVVSEDPDNYSITVREKSTGEVTTMTLNPDTKSFDIKTQSGESGSVRIGDDGKVLIESENGKAVFGASSGGSLPSWLPTYPGTTPVGNMTAETPTGKSTTFSFKTSDAPEKVLDFYKKELQSAGFELPTTVTQADGGMIMAQDGEKRQVVLTVSASGDSVLSVTERQ